MSEVIEAFSKNIFSLPAPVPQAQVSAGVLFPCTGRKDGVHRSRSVFVKASFDCATLRMKSFNRFSNSFFRTIYKGGEYAFRSEEHG